MVTIHDILDQFRQAAVTEREKGTYFEELIVCYLRNEATYRDLYQNVWTYSEWADRQGLDKRDTGIDLVAETQGTGEFHAIQCKNYAPDYRIQKKDIDSFFTASGKKPFTHRIIVTTTNNWSEHAEDALQGQQPPVSKIDLHDLENSQIDWSKYQSKTPVKLKKKKSLLPHQRPAVEAVLKGFNEADRGKLIMACGTGKTFTSLKIAEEFAGRGRRVLFLVPSLSLLSQTLTEWTQESAIPLHSFAVCSDSDVGKKRKKEDDAVQTFTHELRIPATTESKKLAQEMNARHDDEHMSVVFSTYHSIDVISKAQHKYDLADFDLIVCDEAHRTTGATFGDDADSAFVSVHDAKFLRSKKRLYMTATPRIYSDAFCQVIELGKEGKTHKVSSKQIARMFQSVVEAYQETDETDKEIKLACEAEHVDGGMNASEKEAKLDWLKAEIAEDTCRILSNVRCLRRLHSLARVTR
jgi:predicted helicase